MMRHSTKLLCLLPIFLILTACGAGDLNDEPVIHGVSSSPSVVYAGEQSILAIVATDLENDPLTYHWSALHGHFTTDTTLDTVIYVAPLSGKSDQVTIRVADGIHTLSTTIDITILSADEPMVATDTPLPAPSLTPEPSVPNSPVGYFQSDCEREENNFKEQANGPLYFGSVHCGFIDDPYDFFWVDVPSSGQLTVRITDYLHRDSLLQIFHNSTSLLVYESELDGHAVINLTVEKGIYYISFVNRGILNYPDPYFLFIDYSE